MLCQANARRYLCTLLCSHVKREICLWQIIVRRILAEVSQNPNCTETISPFHIIYKLISPHQNGHSTVKNPLNCYYLSIFILASNAVLFLIAYMYSPSTSMFPFSTSLETVKTECQMGYNVWQTSKSHGNMLEAMTTSRMAGARKWELPFLNLRHGEDVAESRGERPVARK